MSIDMKEFYLIVFNKYITKNWNQEILIIKN